MIEKRDMGEIEKPKMDPHAPLTVPELLGMQLRYKDDPVMQRVINAALLRRAT